jgi:hypothetical protein
MKKIISLFARNYDGDRLVRDEIVPGAEWVVDGEGFASEKYDGTCCLVEDGALFKRYDAKKGKQPPTGFVPAQEPDPVTGHWPGWLKVGEGTEDQWFREAWISAYHPTFDGEVTEYIGPAEGTYELVGPKVQGNPYGLAKHALWRHGETVLDDVPRDFAGIREWLSVHPNVEGIVWHRDRSADPDMVKLKRRDFGLPWPVK